MKRRSSDWDSDELEFLWGMGTTLEEWFASHIQCPPLALLRAANAGALPDETAEQVNAHLGDCALCRRLLADFDECGAVELTPSEEQRLYALLDDAVRKEKAHANRLGWSFRWRPAIALTGIALFALGLAWQAGYFQSQPDPAIAPPPMQARTSVPVPVQTVFVLEKPKVRLTAAAIVWRGSGGTEQFSQDLGAAFDAYRADDYAAAEEKFSRLAAQYPRSVEAAFYLGVCRLFLNQPSAGVAALERAQRLADNNFASDIAWYLALGYHRANQSAQARLQLSQLCKGRSDYATKACAGLQELENRPPESSSR